MNKDEVTALLKRNYNSFINFFDSLSNEVCDYTKEGKWSSSFHAAHLVLSVKPLTHVFEMDKSAIAHKFGSTTKTGHSYQEMKTFYLEKLSGGGKAPDRFVPDNEMARQKSLICQNLELLIDQLSTSIERFSEEELDSLCVPHPLLGNLSLREMLYNAIYHAEHHKNLIIKMIHEKLD